MIINLTIVCEICRVSLLRHPTEYKPVCPILLFYGCLLKTVLFFVFLLVFHLFLVIFAILRVNTDMI